MDWEILLPGFILFAPLGFIYGALATFHYSRSRTAIDTTGVPVAIVAFGLQYIFILTLVGLGRYTLLPTILMFFAAMALLIAIRIGLKAHTKAGIRIALAAIFTLAAYVCMVCVEYKALAKFHR